MSNHDSISCAITHFGYADYFRCVAYLACNFGKMLPQFSILGFQVVYSCSICVSGYTRFFWCIKLLLFISEALILKFVSVELLRMLLGIYMVC